VLGTDPDSDRVGLLAPDDQGVMRSLSGNQIGLLLLEFILRNRFEQGRLPQKAFAVTTIVSTKLAARVAARYGVQLQETLTGFKFIGERIKQFDEEGDQSFLFGFEESFGYLAGTCVRDKDAVQAALLLAEMAAEALHLGETLPARLTRLF
jgi:phosphoglucomutase